jgi:CsoR family transcriptional regulator, copper-sensing transcriptional repressor
MRAAEGSPVHGYAERRDELLTRLRRIEGQVRGLQRMLEEDRYCIDVLTQISSATRALQGVAVNLLDEHVRHCVRDAITEGADAADDKVDEALEVIHRLITR